MRWWRSHDSFSLFHSDFWYESTGHPGPLWGFQSSLTPSCSPPRNHHPLWSSLPLCAHSWGYETGNLLLALVYTDLRIFMLVVEEWKRKEIVSYKSWNLYQFSCSHPCLSVSEMEAHSVAIICWFLRLEWTCEFHESQIVTYFLHLNVFSG